MVRRLDSLLHYLDERLGKHSGRGPEYQFHCPACIDRTGSESEGRKLGVNLSKRVGGCFRCGFRFRSLRALFMYLNGGRVLMEELALLRDEPILPEGRVSTHLKKQLRRRGDESVVKLNSVLLPRENVVLSKVSERLRSTPRLKPAFDYLFETRGATEEMLSRFSIGYCPIGRYARRLTFPVFQDGSQVYFTTRYCGDHKLKSLNAQNQTGFHQRSTCLLGYDRCVGVPAIAVVEGPFDLMAYEYAVALMGKYLSQEQLWLIARLVEQGLEEVVISLDDKAGREADALYRALLPVVPVVSVLPLDEGDPWSRRADLPALLEGRSEPSVGSRLRGRLST